MDSHHRNDPFYRYKIPSFEVLVKGKNQGAKSFLINLQEISKSVKRPPLHILKFFGYELGVQTNASDSKYYLKGVHTAAELAHIFDAKFMKNFVICGNCSNPETIIDVEKERAYIRCTACGSSMKMNTSHKLVNFIVKHTTK